MSLLHLNEVTYSWDGDKLLDQVTLNLDAGEHIGLVGRNGCGNPPCSSCWPAIFLPIKAR